MPITYTNLDQTKTTASTPVYALGAGDTLIVGADAQLVTTGILSPVVTGPNGVELRIQGDLIAAVSHGVELNAGADIRIAATGSISAGRDGIHINDGSQSISNAGAIEAELIGIDMGDGGELINNGLISGARGVLANGFLQLLNAGTIQAYDNPGDLEWNAYGVQVIGSASIVNSGTIQALDASAIAIGGVDSALILLNTGLISTLAFTAVQTGNGNDEVINQGTIVGGAFLGQGNDLYDGTMGVVSGEVYGSHGDDTLLGGRAGEVLDGALGNDQVAGGDGDDTVSGGGGIDLLDGGAGFDILNYRSDGTGVSVSLTTGEATGGEAEGDVFAGFEGVVGGTGGDTLVGSVNADRLWGDAGDDFLSGGGGGDRLVGGMGNDTLFGGAGLDVLRGGEGDDTFRFNSITDSGGAAGTRDRILDFSTADLDVIHLASIDANTGMDGNQAFTFIGTSAFTNVAGQLRYAPVSNGMLVTGDVNGDGAADFAIQLAGLVLLSFTDFVL